MFRSDKGKDVVPLEVTQAVLNDIKQPLTVLTKNLQRLSNTLDKKEIGKRDKKVN